MNRDNHSPNHQRNNNVCPNLSEKQGPQSNQTQETNNNFVTNFKIQYHQRLITAPGEVEVDPTSEDDKKNDEGKRVIDETKKENE